jgi:hypothetical protein
VPAGSRRVRTAFGNIIEAATDWAGLFRRDEARESCGLAGLSLVIGKPFCISMVVARGRRLPCVPQRLRVNGQPGTEDAAAHTMQDSANAICLRKPSCARFPDARCTGQ